VDLAQDVILVVDVSWWELVDEGLVVDAAQAS